MIMSLLASAEVRALLDDAADRAGHYLAGLDERPVAPDDAALAGLARFDEPLPEAPGDPAATLALLDEAGSAATVASAGGRYFGFVIGVVLNQVLVRSATDDQTQALIAAVQQDGTCWCGPTVWQHRPAMRISVSGWATTAEDIQSADAIITAAQLAARS
jgi:hypothetical protein